MVFSKDKFVKRLNKMSCKWFLFGMKCLRVTKIKLEVTHPDGTKTEQFISLP